MHKLLTLLGPLEVRVGYVTCSAKNLWREVYWVTIPNAISFLRERNRLSWQISFALSLFFSGRWLGTSDASLPSCSPERERSVLKMPELVLGWYQGATV